MRVGEALRRGAGLLEDERISSPRLTAEILLAHTLERDRVFLHAHAESTLKPESADRFFGMIRRRLQREPLEYITGLADFYGRGFRVGPSVLIPRPETEVLVDTALELSGSSPTRILDVGTGSGCIAATLALELKDSRMFASDISLEALKTARFNAGRIGATVLFAASDLLAAWKGPFDVVVSNPPYVPPEDRNGLQPEVGRYEPEIALFGGPALYTRLVSDAWHRLVPGGWLILEIGYSMAETVGARFGEGWEGIRVRSDLQGIPRVIAGRKTHRQGKVGLQADGL